MELIYGVINITSFDSLQVPDIWNKEKDFYDVKVEEIQYKYVYSFPHYFEDETFRNQFDLIFEADEAFWQWVKEGLPYEPEWEEIEL